MAAQWRLLAALGIVMALGAVAAAPAIAQIQTGSILVRVTDEQGAMLPGATITISSDALVAGRMSAVSDEGGVYRFPSLTPGTYAVKIDLSGFQSVIRENIAVLVGQTTPIDMSLKVANVQEVVTVTTAASTVDTTSANQSVNLSESLLQKTPGGRDIWAVLEYKVPSLVMSRPDVGGTSGGLQGSYSARGTNNSQNSQFLNGINVGDPAAIGAAGYYYDFDAFEEIQVSTGAHDITVPTSGVFLNMATKSGGNTWAGRTTFAWEGNGTQGQNIDDELLALGFRPITNEVDYVSDVNVTGGGPLIKNKVRFFGSFRDWRVHVNVPVQQSQTVLDQTNITSGLGNVTWQVNDKNRVTGFVSRQKYDKPNRLLNSASITVPESTVNEQDRFGLYQGLWNSVLSSKWFVDARAGYNTILFPTYFNGGNNQSLTDTVTGIIYGNNTTEVIRHRNRFQANATAQYYLDHALGGRHEFRFGFDHAHAVTKNTTHRIDDVMTTYSSTTGLGQNVTLYSTPLNDASATDVTALYAQDSYSIKRLTLVAGVRWERLEGYLPEQNSDPSQYFPNLQRDFGERRDVVLWHTAGPRVSAIYDLKGDGLTALKGSWGRYYYVLSTGGGGVSNVNLNATYSEQYNWNDANRDLKFQLGEQTGTPVITSGITTTIDPSFKRPYTDELALGVDRQVLPDLKLSVAYTYRREKNIQVSANPANPYATVPSVGIDPGLDGLTGTADDGTFQYFDRISAINPTLITNDPSRVLSYKGLEITGTKRLSNRWQMVAGYTRSVNRQDHTSLDTSPNLLINADGRIDYRTTPVNTVAYSDRPNQFKLTGTYLLPYQDIEIGANFRSQSGPPLTRQISQRLSFGGNQTINLQPLGDTARLPTVNTFDVRASKYLKFGARELLAAIDIYNVANVNTVWEVRTLTPAIPIRQGGDGEPHVIPQFLSPTQVIGPRIARFTVTFRF
jgi:Carboxypeptidase regulatory-like domain/TonB-dependent Receptor Plug Domain